MYNAGVEVVNSDFLQSDSIDAYVCMYICRCARSKLAIGNFSDNGSWLREIAFLSSSFQFYCSAKNLAAGLPDFS
jgi:hypothetical protein